MIVVIAPDSFKECATAAQVAGAVAAGWQRADPEAELRLVPVADGGEGTVEALAAAGGPLQPQERNLLRRLRAALAAADERFRETEVTGPAGETVAARWALLDNGVAVIEMAAAAGLHLVAPQHRDPMMATTRGVGELIRAGLDAGARRFIVGVGGSATNDGGAGMAQALGASLRDAEGRELGPGGAALAGLAEVDVSGMDARLAECTVFVACDVDNPLCGPEGASHVYGPQKGASPAQAAELDAALARYAAALRAALGMDLRDTPGAGAAGGLAAGLMAFLHAQLIPGFDLVAEQAGLAAALEGAHLVITGEGSMDGQSLRGKVPVGVARMARERGVPCIVLAGRLGDGYAAAYDMGVTAAFAIEPGPVSREESIENALDWLADRAEALARIWLAASGLHA